MSWFRPELTSSTKTLAKAFAMPELAPVTTAVGMTVRDCFTCFGRRTTWMVLLSVNFSNVQMVSRQFRIQHTIVQNDFIMFLMFLGPLRSEHELHDVWSSMKQQRLLGEIRINGSGPR